VEKGSSLAGAWKRRPPIDLNKNWSGGRREGKLEGAPKQSPRRKDGTDGEEERREGRKELNEKGLAQTPGGERACEGGTEVTEES